MKNFVYTQEYPFTPDKGEDEDDETMRHLVKVAQRYHSYLVQMPKYINPVFSLNFAIMLSKCDQLAKAHWGKIRAEVDYKTYEATINVWTDFLEFNSGEFLDLLQSFALHSTSVLFQPLTTGKLKLMISMPYFSYLSEPESLNAFIKNHPEADLPAPGDSTEG